MRFDSTARYEGYAVTARKVAAFERKKVAQRAALPLFAEATAATQISADEEMQRRIEATERQRQERRNQIAKRWRDVRARFYALPAHVRAPIAAKWARFTGPATSSNLLYMIQTVAAPMAAEPDDFPQISAERRHAETVRLNDMALADDPWARCERVLSPGVMLWLSPFFMPTNDVPAPRMHLDTSSGRAMQLHYALARFEDFGHNSDPSGEHRAGSFAIEHTSFRFAISYLGRNRPRCRACHGRPISRAACCGSASPTSSSRREDGTTERTGMNVRGELIDLINRLIAVPETENEEIRIANRISYLSPDENWSDYLSIRKNAYFPADGWTLSAW